MANLASFSIIERFVILSKGLLTNPGYFYTHNGSEGDLVSSRSKMTHGECSR